MKQPAKKKNPQDATRKKDVDPLRRRVAKLEATVKGLETRLKDLEAAVAMGANDEGQD